MELLKRLKENITLGEMAVIRQIAKIEESEIVINASDISTAAESSKSMTNTVLRMLVICGIIECKSRGSKGTYLKIVDRKALNEIAKSK